MPLHHLFSSVIWLRGHQGLQFKYQFVFLIAVWCYCVCAVSGCNNWMCMEQCVIKTENFLFIDACHKKKWPKWTHWTPYCQYNIFCHHNAAVHMVFTGLTPITGINANDGHDVANGVGRFLIGSVSIHGMFGTLIESSNQRQSYSWSS